MRGRIFIFLLFWEKVLGYGEKFCAWGVWRCAGDDISNDDNLNNTFSLLIRCVSCAVSCVMSCEWDLG